MISVVERVKRTNPVFVEAHISDIHFGATDPAKQFKILKEQFLDYIDKLQVLDIVSINGDIFDHKFMANSDAVMYACNFIELLDLLYQNPDMALAQLLQSDEFTYTKSEAVSDEADQGYTEFTV